MDQSWLLILRGKGSGRWAVAAIRKGRMGARSGRAPDCHPEEQERRRTLLRARGKVLRFAQDDKGTLRMTKAR